MKKVLILVVSSQKPPYDVMMQTALDTWDSFEVEGVETIYYCGAPIKENTNKIIYFPIREEYANMGHKMLEAFQWAVKNKEFDYIARVNSSCYVDKKQLIKYIQTLEADNVFAGLEVKDDPKWMLGGGQFVLSRDLIYKVLENKDKWNHSLMEDVALSHLISNMGIDYTKGIACSINQKDGEWLLLSYGGCDNFLFTDFADVKKNSTHHFYRVKQDYQRYLDKIIMENLYKVLK